MQTSKFGIVAFAIHLSTVNAYAEMPAPIETVFYCTTNSNQAIEIYKQGNYFIYQYGAHIGLDMNKTPELRLIQHENDVIKTPWPGTGNVIWQNISFEQNGYTYEVVSSMARKQKNDYRASVYVHKGTGYAKKAISYVPCNRKEPIVDYLDEYAQQ